MITIIPKAYAGRSKSAAQNPFGIERWEISYALGTLSLTTPSCEIHQSFPVRRGTIRSRQSTAPRALPHVRPPTPRMAFTYNYTGSINACLRADLIKTPSAGSDKWIQHYLSSDADSLPSLPFSDSGQYGYHDLLAKALHYLWKLTSRLRLLSLTITLSSHRNIK